ncbi:hypothetical protein L9F63_002778, partial [Diploptera punctata]
DVTLESNRMSRQLVASKEVYYKKWTHTDTFNLEVMTLFFFSPVAESPVKKILQCGNLTGNVRRICDLAAELYNLIQDWNTHHILGTQILNNIMEITSPILIENAANESSIIYAEKLEQCEKLDETVRNMNDIVMKLIEGSQQMHSVEKLEYPSHREPNRVASLC